MPEVSDSNGASVKQGWWDVVERLKDDPLLGEKETLSILEEAVAAAEGDPAWSHSGIMELLRRAKEQAKSGHAASASKSAIGLLSFHNVVLRFKSSAGGGSSSSEGAGGKRQRASSPTTSSDGDGTARPDSNSSPNVSSDDTGLFAHPEICMSPNAATRKRSHQQQQQQQAAASSLSFEATSTWQGSVSISGGGNLPSASSPLPADLEFCKLSIQVPKSLMGEMPKALSILHISPRRAISSHGQLACPTCVTEAHPQHLVYLRKMAQQELAAVMQLQDCLAILVPYVGKGGVVRAVTFLVAPPAPTPAL